MCEATTKTKGTPEAWQAHNSQETKTTHWGKTALGGAIQIHAPHIVPASPESLPLFLRFLQLLPPTRVLDGQHDGRTGLWQAASYLGRT